MLPLPNETETYRPQSILSFLQPGIQLQPEPDEFMALQRLHNEKHLVRFDSEIAQKQRMCNR